MRANLHGKNLKRKLLSENRVKSNAIFIAIVNFCIKVLCFTDLLNFRFAVVAEDACNRIGLLYTSGEDMAP